MSFILDALRRAESQRGSQQRPVSAETPLGHIAEPEAAPLLSRKLALTLLAGAIVIAAAAIVLTLNRDSGNGIAVTSDAPAGQRAPVFSGVSPDTSLADVAGSAAREIRPLDEVARRAVPARPAANTGDTAERVAAATRPTSRGPGSVTVSQEPLQNGGSRNIGNVSAEPEENLPSYQTLALSGRVQLPAFHLDIHVFAEQPDRRFVFVNNRKYREGEQLEEGGTVERITPNGVILNHRGHRFELAPD